MTSLTQLGCTISGTISVQPLLIRIQVDRELDMTSPNREVPNWLVKASAIFEISNTQFSPHGNKRNLKMATKNEFESGWDYLPKELILKIAQE